MKVVIVFKNGYELKITCEDFEVDYDLNGIINTIKAEEVYDNAPVYIDFKEVLCIYRIADGKGENNE